MAVTNWYCLGRTRLLSGCANYGTVALTVKAVHAVAPSACIGDVFLAIALVRYVLDWA
jgi:hypothetical protein